VLYLLRHVHTADVDFLRAFHADDDAWSVTPVNAVGVLSRADEMAGGREDALAVAARIAGQYRAEPRVRALVQTVVPVCGLLGLAAVELTQARWEQVAALAAEPEHVLLSADRFLASGGRPDAPGAVPSDARAALLDDLGLFGVRLAVAAVRSGDADDAGTLAAVLRAASGLDDVRALLTGRFVGRSSALKAQHALRTVEALLGAVPVAGADRLRRQVEGVVAGAHDLVELRLLADLRTGELDVGDDDLRAEAERLLGGDGDDARVRLGLPADAPNDEMQPLAVATLLRWQRRAAHPFAGPDVRRVAEVVRRTCEGLAAGAG
jgi:hypothetical protein